MSDRIQASYMMHRVYVKNIRHCHIVILQVLYGLVISNKTHLFYSYLHVYTHLHTILIVIHFTLSKLIFQWISGENKH